jgi:hypothetical protein
MAFDAGYSFRDAYAQTGEVKHLCGEIRMMIRFLNYLDHHVAPGERPTIGLDAQKSLDAARDELGDVGAARTSRPSPSPSKTPEPASRNPRRGPAAVVPSATAQASTHPPPRRGLKIAGWTLFALASGSASGARPSWRSAR